MPAYVRGKAKKLKMFLVSVSVLRLIRPSSKQIYVKRVLEFPPKTDPNDEVSSSPQIVENQILSSRPSTLQSQNK